MGDRVAVLKSGVLQQVDTPRALYHKPVNAFVAGFIGSPSMNLFEGRLEGGSIRLPGFAIPLPAGVRERVPGLAAFDGKPVVFGIRPEDLHDSRLPSGAAYPTIPALVRTTEELGSELIVHLKVEAARVDSGDPDAVEDLSGAANTVARFAATSMVKAGEQIDLAIDPAKLHFFDVQTHAAL